jgi:aspartokinase-like uncharacterized kinase
MITARDILQDMFSQVKGICDKTYIIERPASTSDQVNSFIVCSIPGILYNNEISDNGEYDDYSTTVQFEVYVRDKTSASNLNQADINTIDKVVRKLLAKFPMITDHCVIAEPSQSMLISDGKQFHCTIIHADMRSK